MRTGVGNEMGGGAAGGAMSGPGAAGKKSGGTAAAAGPGLRPTEFVPLAALLTSLVALSIDVMLPALRTSEAISGRGARTTCSTS